MLWNTGPSFNQNYVLLALFLALEFSKRNHNPLLISLNIQKHYFLIFLGK